MRALVVACAICATLLATPYEASKAYADFYSRKLPQRLDANFTLTALLNVGEELYYHYKLNDTKKFLFSKLSREELIKHRERLKVASIARHCKDTKVVTMLQKGIVLHHMFYFERARLLFEFKIDKKLCNIP